MNEDDTEGKVTLAADGLVEVGSLVKYVDDLDAGGSHTFVIEPDTDGAGTGVGGWVTSDVVLNSEIGKPLSINVATAVLLGTQPNYENPPLLIVNGATPAAGAATLPAKYIFNLKVVDNGGLYADATTQITINLVDSNEAPSITTGTRIINENSLVNAKAFSEGDDTDTKYQIVDDDIVNGVSVQTATLSIVSGNTGTAFKLSATTGVTDFFEIQVNNAILDYEGTSGTSYFLGINILDVGGTGGGGLTSTATIQIDIVDINDAPVLNDFAVSILETAVENSCVAPNTFSASDEDLPSQNLNYVLTQKGATTWFDVFEAKNDADNRQGQICIKANFPLTAGGSSGSTDQLQLSGYTRTGGASASQCGTSSCVYEFTLTVTDNGAVRFF